jgi:hypothetical protein
MIFTAKAQDRRNDIHRKGPILVICQFDDIMAGAAGSTDSDAVLSGIANNIYFAHSNMFACLFYTMGIEQCTPCIRAFARSYIDPCLVKFNWEAMSMDSSMPVPPHPTS